MLRINLKIAIRNLFKNRLYSIINITGLSIGMAACILILLWVTDEMNYNKFNENIDNIFLIPQTQHYQTIGDFTVTPTPLPLVPALRQEYPEIEYAVRYQGGLGTSKITYKDKTFNQQVNFTEPEFFKIFTFPVLNGDKKNLLTDKSSIIITQEMAEKYFGNENPIGKILKMDDKYDLIVSAVIKDMPHNSDIKFDMLVSINLLEDFGFRMNNWGFNMLNSYVTLKNPGQYLDVSNKISGRLKKELDAPTAGKLFLFPYKDYHLYSIKGKGGRIETVIIFSIVALIILIIACFNFMNLATARSAKRATEVGIKKVVGATRFQLAKQFFAESILLTIISLAIAVMLAEAFLPLFNQVSGKELTFSQISTVTFALILIITVLTGIFSGIYPAIFLSSFKPVKILKGNYQAKTSRLSLRTVLVVMQFAISIILIIGTVIVYLQMNYILHKDIGLNRDNIVYFNIDTGLKENIDALKTELMRNTNVKSATVTRSLPIFVYNNGGGWSWKGMNPKQDELVTNLGADYDLLKTYDIKLNAGRYFSKEFAASDSASLVINQSFADLIGYKNPVGEYIKQGSNSYKIIGVVNNFNFTKLDRMTGPLVIYNGSGSVMSVKISNAEISKTLDFIQSTCKQFNSKFVFDYDFVDKTYEKQYRSEQRLGNIFNSFAALAIIISCLGLLGLSSFVAEQKTKEIGIRKVLGSSVSGIVILLSKQFIKWVLFANLIAWPVAYYFMSNWLKDYAYRIDMPYWTFLIAALVALIISVLTVSTQAIRAANSDPIKSLRYE